MHVSRWLLVCGWSMLIFAVSLDAAEVDTKGLAEALKGAETNVFPAEKRPELARMLGNEINARRRAANERSSAAWRGIKDRASWEKFRDQAMQSLKDGLAQPPEKLNVRVTKRLEGEGHRIECLVFESRPGLWVTANLYTPTEPAASMPGILICHSHHNPKTEGELQDMGVNWARLGCLVLVMDQLGHGERRQHPFASEKDYPKPFRAGRQDYWFRYNAGMQLALVGESLGEWMAWDLMRGVDLLLARPGIDPKRIILLGAVAGGGDPAALAGALDPRIACVVPFNFGGPQPESPFPLPDDAEAKFNYGGSGSWESTRNLRDLLSDGFLPWVIVGSIAPRRLIYSHEFRWDQPRDPVWKRLEQIYAWEEAPKHLAFAHGTGGLSGKPPEASHCNNIGEVHRKMIYPALKEWFGIPIPDPEVRIRRPSSELLCLMPAPEPPLEMKPLGEVLKDLAAARLAQDKRRNTFPLEPKPSSGWYLGRPVNAAKSEDLGKITVEHPAVDLPGARVERLAIQTTATLVAPFVLITPKLEAGASRPPVVLCVSQGGKKSFLQKEAGEIAALLAAKIAVCLVDVRGTGEIRCGDDRGRGSEATSLASTELMLGQTLLKGQIYDLGYVLDWLWSREDLDGRQFALWGSSHAAVNPADREWKVPYDVDTPKLGEPMGGLVALYAPEHWGPQVVLAEGTLKSWASVLDSPFVHLPHDAIVPNGVTDLELDEAAAFHRGHRLRISSSIDGLNRAVSQADLEAAYPLARKSFEAVGKGKDLSLAAESAPGAASKWLIEGLRKP